MYSKPRRNLSSLSGKQRNQRSLAVDKRQKTQLPSPALQKSEHSKIRSVSVPKKTKSSKLTGPSKSLRPFLSTNLVDAGSYRNFGRSSDSNYENEDVRYKFVPNPFLELHRAANVILRQYRTNTAVAHQASLTSGNCNNQPERTAWDDQSTHTSQEDGETGGRGEEGEVGEKGEEEEDDEDEEEEGLPQAVRTKEPGHEPSTSQDVMRSLYVQKMEAIAKNVKPVDVLSKLYKDGFLTHTYQTHVRTTQDQTNLKAGNKKGLERLYVLLANYYY